MRLAELQATIHERGRIRIGYSTASSRGTKVPHKLKTYRFSAAHPDILAPVAEAYGGEVVAWPEGDARNRWQVTTEADRIPVIYPVGMGLSQSYDRYAKGFHTLACDGERCHVPGSRTWRVCECDPLERVCQVTTQLSLILPELPGLGVWRLVTHGDYATRELAGSVAFIEEAVARPGVHVQAILELQERTIKRLVDGKPLTMEFIVPVLDTTIVPAALTANHPSNHALPEGRLRLPPGGQERPPGAPESASTPKAGRQWRPVDQMALAPAPEVPLAERFEETNQPPKRSKRKPQLGSSGIAPGGACCPLCGDPYGNEPLVRNPTGEGGRWVHVRCIEVPDRSDVGLDERSSDAPAGAPSLPMSYGQHNHLFALAKEVLGDVSEAERKTQMLAMAKAVGAGELASRTEITSMVASAMIDQLRAVQDGTVVWQDGRFEAVER